VRWQIAKRFRSIGAWATTERAPTAEEADALIALPGKLTAYAFAHWMWSIGWAIYSGLVNFEHLGVQLVRVCVAIFMGSMIACSLTYLAIEDVLRPLYVRALSNRAVRRASVGVRPRLIMAWVAGAATYFVAIGLTVNGFPLSKSAPFLYGACGFALVVGVIVTLTAARSVARPLDVVAAALARIETGDLSASVPVDDAGEIGRLQAGFNRMAGGLRERDRLQKLLERHVGPDVAKRAIASSGLGGVHIEATVMFVDIIGSTALAAERPPDAIVAMVNALFENVIDVVTGAGGLVNQFQGDGALCVFGAPIETPDHAARALRSAVELRRRIVALGDVYPGFDAAIGVSTGRVVAGDVGTEDRAEYTVIGDAANEASRLTDQAKVRGSRVLVSEPTVRAAGVVDDGWVLVGSLELRGRPRPTDVFEPA
jgi:adenylate cyclase